MIVTFAGTVRPSEIKAWPLIYKVESLSPRPLQCFKCWRYGHSVKGCRSGARCRRCGESHDSRDCNSEEEKCCLCNRMHPADSSDCVAKERELSILEIVERRRCSRREAVEELNERSKGYAGVTARHVATMDASFGNVIAEAIESATEKAMERLANNLVEALGQMFSNQLAQMLSTVSMKCQDSQDSLVSKSTEIEKPTTQQRSVSSQAEPAKKVVQADPEPITDYSDDFTDMDTESQKSLKRTRSPPSKMSPQKSKSKKYQSKKDFFENVSKQDFLKNDILDQAVSATVLASK